jgi:adenylate kinase family enzyme/GNAT superfamily N-acetyltransferase
VERVVIIGNGGAGKSTFGRRLAAFTGLPLYHLDRLFWRPGWDPTPGDTWVPLVQSLVSTDRWIAEGNYGGTMAMRIAAADAIIWLDYPRLLCTRRAFWRGLSQRGRTRPHDMAPGCVERVDREFLAWVWAYHDERRPEVKRLLRELAPGRDVVVFRNDDQAARFLLRVHVGERQPARLDPAVATIRLALPSDALALATIHHDGWRAAYGHIFPEEVFARRSIPVRYAEWAELLGAAPGESRTWVSERAGQVAGFAYTLPGSDADLARPGELKLFYTRPDLRGSGIGLPLFDRAVADLRRRGLQPYLYTLKDNAAARAWYERHGWAHDGHTEPWSQDDEYPGVMHVRYRPRQGASWSVATNDQRLKTED